MSTNQYPPRIGSGAGILPETLQVNGAIVGTLHVAVSRPAHRIAPGQNAIDKRNNALVQVGIAARRGCRRSGRERREEPDAWLWPGADRSGVRSGDEGGVRGVGVDGYVALRLRPFHQRRTDRQPRHQTTVRCQPETSPQDPRSGHAERPDLLPDGRQCRRRPWRHHPPRPAMHAHSTCMQLR